MCVQRLSGSSVHQGEVRMVNCRRCNLTFSPAHLRSSTLATTGFSFIGARLFVALEGCSATAVAAANFLRALMLTWGKKVDMALEEVNLEDGIFL